MDSRQKRLAITAGVVLVAAGGLLALQYRPARPPEITATYYDEESGQEIELKGAEANAIPPAAGPSGKETRVYAVHAYSPSGQQREIVYLKKYPPDVKREMEQTMANEGHIREFRGFDQRALVRWPAAGSPWVPVGSAEGAALLQEAESKLVSP